MDGVSIKNETTGWDKEAVLHALREHKFRITKQRQLILDVILSGECSCCKEIYYTAAKLDQTIGAATIYRMINTLEEIGVMERKNAYQLSYCKDCDMDRIKYLIQFNDESELILSEQDMKEILTQGLKQSNYTEHSSKRIVCMRAIQE